MLKKTIRKRLNYKDYRNNEWTQEEFKFLKENWGKMSVKDISKNINRSVCAIKSIAARLGLKDFFIYSSKITLNYLHYKIYHRNMDSYTLGIWKRYNMPFDKSVKVECYEYLTITIENFIKWLKVNKRLIDLSLTEEGFLNIDEPDWMKEKRIADKKAAVYGPHNKVWTIKEDNQLKKLISQKYSYRDISIKLKRTGGAVKRRIHDLKLTEKPPKAYNHNKWTSQEIDLVKNMWLKGYKTCVIQEYLENRSDLAINGLLERYKYFDDPPLKFIN